MLKVKMKQLLNSALLLMLVTAISYAASKNTWLYHSFGGWSYDSSGTGLSWLACLCLILCITSFLYLKISDEINYLNITGVVQRATKSPKVINWLVIGMLLSVVPGTISMMLDWTFTTTLLDHTIFLLKITLKLLLFAWVEELIFRGIILDVLHIFLGNKLPIIFTSISFSLVHTQYINYPLIMAVTTLFSVALCLLRISGQPLINLITLHFGINFFSHLIFCGPDGTCFISLGNNAAFLILTSTATTLFSIWTIARFIIFDAR